MFKYFLHGQQECTFTQTLEMLDTVFFYMTTSSVILHAGSSDISLLQSVKLDSGKRIISGPLPVPYYGDIRFSRICQSHQWLNTGPVVCRQLCSFSGPCVCLAEMDFTQTGPALDYSLWTCALLSYPVREFPSGIWWINHTPMTVTITVHLCITFPLFTALYNCQGWTTDLTVLCISAHPPQHCLSEQI